MVRGRHHKSRRSTCAARPNLLLKTGLIWSRSTVVGTSTTWTGTVPASSIVLVRSTVWYVQGTNNKRLSTERLLNVSNLVLGGVIRRLLCMNRSVPLHRGRWHALLNASGRRVMISNCHQGHIIPNATWCPFDFFKTSGDPAVVGWQFVRILLHLTYACDAHCCFASVMQSWLLCLEQMWVRSTWLGSVQPGWKTVFECEKWVFHSSC